MSMITSLTRARRKAFRQEETSDSRVLGRVLGGIIVGMAFGGLAFTLWVVSALAPRI